MRAAWAKLALGALLVAVALVGQDIAGWMTASRRVPAELLAATAPVNVIVVLGFTPERFHNERLARYGVFAGRDKSVNRIKLRMVTPEKLRGLAELVWVERVERM